ncbi:unnamed protein product, partial [Ectocarpus sp. 8 AP-2014]
ERARWETPQKRGFERFLRGLRGRRGGQADAKPRGARCLDGGGPQGAGELFERGGGVRGRHHRRNGGPLPSSRRACRRIALGAGGPGPTAWHPSVSGREQGREEARADAPGERAREGTEPGLHERPAAGG